MFQRLFFVHSFPVELSPAGKFPNSGLAFVYGLADWTQIWENVVSGGRNSADDIIQLSYFMRILSFFLCPLFGIVIYLVAVAVVCLTRGFFFSPVNIVGII